jgi:tetratricopeptide (TPR) repeat protein
VPRMRPWEYHNELFGGPGNGYRYFADEGVDMGQRSLDFARYYHERLEPAGEVPYLFYPMSRFELKRLGVRVRDARGSESDWTDVPAAPSGVFFVRSTQMMRQPQRFAPFREAAPVDRIGNLLIFRGSFSLPWMREENLIRLGRQSLTSTRPDLDKAEGHFQQALALNTKSFGALLNLGNIALRRGQREQALDFYVRARDEVREDLAMREALIKQIDRVSREPLDVIPPLRGTRVE